MVKMSTSNITWNQILHIGLEYRFKENQELLHDNTVPQWSWKSVLSVKTMFMWLQEYHTQWLHLKWPRCHGGILLRTEFYAYHWNITLKKDENCCMMMQSTNVCLKYIVTLDYCFYLLYLNPCDYFLFLELNIPKKWTCYNNISEIGTTVP